MKLQFLKEIPLETLRKNIENNFSNYALPTNEWIFSFFGDVSPFLDFKKEVPDFELNMSYEKPEKSDIENIKILYSSLKDLSVVEATSESLWVGMAHSTFWNYMQYRLYLDRNKSYINNIKNSFFFSKGRKRSLIEHTLSRLWWAGKMAYDENREDPFELLEVFNTDFRTKLLYLFSSNFTNNPTITRAFLSSVLDFEKNGVKIKREIFNETIMYLNILGGTYILDDFEESELKDKITKKIDDLLLASD